MHTPFTFITHASHTHAHAQGMPRRVAKAKVACLDMNLQKARMMMGVQVLVNDPKELEKVSTFLY